MKPDRTEFLQRIEAKREFLEKGSFIVADSGGPVIVKTTKPSMSLDEMHTRLSKLLQ